MYTPGRHCGHSGEEKRADCLENGPEMYRCGRPVGWLVRATPGRRMCMEGKAHRPWWKALPLAGKRQQGCHDLWRRLRGCLRACGCTAAGWRPSFADNDGAIEWKAPHVGSLPLVAAATPLYLGGVSTPGLWDVFMKAGSSAVYPTGSCILSCQAKERLPVSRQSRSRSTIRIHHQQASPCKSKPPPPPPPPPPGASCSPAYLCSHYCQRHQSDRFFDCPEL